MTFHGKNIIDISLNISDELPVFPGDVEFELKRKKKIADGDNYNLSYLQMGAHCGTHLDAPLHFIEDGKAINEIAPERLINRVQVIEIENKEKITREELTTQEIKEKYILFKTRNSYSSEFEADYVYLTLEGARFLLDKGVELIGIDYLSVEEFKGASAPVHKLLLKNGVLILEGIDLDEVEEGIYTLLVMPLKVENSDGAPARVFLIEE